jgi:hypothetical protein
MMIATKGMPAQALTRAMSTMASHGVVRNRTGWSTRPRAEQGAVDGTLLAAVQGELPDRTADHGGSSHTK